MQRGMGSVGSLATAQLLGSGWRDVTSLKRSPARTDYGEDTAASCGCGQPRSAASCRHLRAGLTVLSSLPANRPSRRAMAGCPAQRRRRRGGARALPWPHLRSGRFDATKSSPMQPH